MRWKMNKENFSLVYFSARALFLGIVYSWLISKGGPDAIIACILGTILGCLFTTLINKAPLKSKIYRYIKIILYMLFLCIGTFVLEIFINDFFLIKTPKWFIITPSIILCIYTSFKEMTTFKYTSFILFFLSLFLIFIVMLCCLNIFDTNNLQPLFTSKVPSLFRSSLIFATVSATPQILVKDENIPLKKHLLYYLFTAGILIIVCVFILGVLSADVARVYRFPEYIVLKRIKIFNTIENIENILCSIWYIDYFIFLSLTFKNLYKEVKEKKIPFYLLGVGTVVFTSLFLGSYYYPIMFIYNNIDLILIVFIILFSFSTIKKLFISSERHK